MTKITSEQIVKQVMVIQSNGQTVETVNAFAINGESDLDNLSMTLSFKLPYEPPELKNVSEASVDLTRLEKYDAVGLFYGAFSVDPGDVTSETAGMVKVFDGYIDSIKLSNEKNGPDYSIHAIGTLGLANDFVPEVKITSDQLDKIIRDLLDSAGLADLPIVMNVANAETFTIILKGGQSVKELLDGVKEDYALIIHQIGSGEVKVSSYFDFAVNSSVEVFEFDRDEGNLFKIDYGDLTSDINTVVVFGAHPAYGVVADAIAIEKNGGKVNIEYFEKRNIFSDKECEDVGKRKLLDIQKNYAVSVHVPFNAGYEVGKAFKIKDYDRYSGDELFFIKKYSFVIDKNDVSATLTGYTHSLVNLPSEIVTSFTGVLQQDVGTFRIDNKSENTVSWGNF